MGIIRTQSEIIKHRAVARNDDELKFSELDIGDEFIFIYELKYARRLEKHNKVSKYLPFIASYIKVSDCKYEFSKNNIIWTNSKFITKISRNTNGYTHNETDVILVE